MRNTGVGRADLRCRRYAGHRRRVEVRALRVDVHPRTFDSQIGIDVGECGPSLREVESDAVTPARHQELPLPAVGERKVGQIACQLEPALGRVAADQAAPQPVANGRRKNQWHVAVNLRDVGAR
jgi:hypothetical protein